MQWLKTISLIVLSVLTTSASAATPFKLYQVNLTNPKDTLNLRAKPNTTADIILKIPNKTSILVTGVEKQVGNTLWAQVHWYNFNSWVNKKYLKPSTALNNLKSVVPKSLPTFKCVGTEPFWNFNIKRGVIQGEDFSVGTKYNTSITKSNISTTKNIYLIQSPKLNLLLQKTNTCSDGMSDKVYKYHVDVLLPNKNYLTGCCN